jgi:hypothetical protein
LDDFAPKSDGQVRVGHPNVSPSQIGQEVREGWASSPDRILSSLYITGVFQTIESLPHRRSRDFQLVGQVNDRQALVAAQKIQDQLVDWPGGYLVVCWS